MPIPSEFKPLFKLLFRLKYVEGIRDFGIISAVLDIPDYITEIYLKRLDEYLESKLNAITAERLEYVCPECLEARVYEDPETGERICANCGYVVSSMECYSTDLPFDTTYALTSELAFGRSLGGTLGYRGMLRVLAKSPSNGELAKNGNSHLGVRARLAQIVAETVEPSAVREALNKATELSHAYGLQSNHAFNNTVGLQIRRAYIFAYILIGKAPFKHHLAETCFWLTLKKFGKTAQAQQFFEEHEREINFSLATALEDFESFLEVERQKAKLRSEALKEFPALLAES